MSGFTAKCAYGTCSEPAHGCYGTQHQASSWDWFNQHIPLCQQHKDELVKCDECNVINGTCDCNEKTEETLYAIQVVNDIAPFNTHDSNRNCTLSQWTYYQTYGGGPEGGYVLHTYRKPWHDTNREEWYKVNRDWLEVFTMEPLGFSSKHRVIQKDGVDTLIIEW